MEVRAVDSLLGPITSWLSPADLRAIYSSDYWNDVAEERKKEWWIEVGESSCQRLLAYLDNSGLMTEYQIAEQSILEMPGSNLAIADLAAGIGWASALLSRLPNVGSVHAVEVSQHRLDLLFPQAVRMFNGNAAKLHRYIGSFYKLGFDSESMDVVFLSQAFHHAATPVRLLSEIDRVLKPGGRLILIGEHFIGGRNLFRAMLKVLLTEGRLCTNFYELFPPDKVAGDHFYRVSDYFLFLQLMGYQMVRCSVQKKRSTVVIADKQILDVAR